MSRRGYVDRARGRRRDRTHAEIVLWRHLRRRALGVKFRREDPFSRYIADFCSREARLIVETDGATHADPGRDARRDAWFADRGWLVLRFRDDEVLGDLDAVLETIARAVQARVPTATPRRRDDPGRADELGHA